MRDEPRLPVWYLAFEDKKSEVRRHFRDMGAAPDDPVEFVFTQPGPNLIAQLHSLAQKAKPALIVVDTLQRLIRAKDLNDYAEVTTKLTPILELSRQTGAALVLVHHAGKGERSGIDAVLGSTALAGSVDNIFLFGRNERYRILSSQQRIGPDLQQTVVVMDDATGRVTSGRTREEADLDLMRGEILAVLGDSPNITEVQLGAEVEGPTALKRKSLRELVKSGSVRREGTGRRGDAYRYSCLLVPVGIWEQENKKPKTKENADKHGPDSCSRETAALTKGGLALEQETATRERFTV